MVDHNDQNENARTQTICFGENYYQGFKRKMKFLNEYVFTENRINIKTPVKW